MYHRITEEERILIHRWKQEGKSNKEIARLLGVHPSTIGRELKRNQGKNGYHPKQAHEMARERARRPGRRKFLPEMQSEVVRCLRSKGWTPAMISGRKRLEGKDFVCRETIMKFIFEEAKTGEFGGDLWKCLTRSGRRRHRRLRRSKDAGRGHIPGRRDISERPAEVERREEVGHWEGDLVCGAPGTGNLVTLVERVTRYAVVLYVKSKECEEVAGAICRGLLPLSMRGVVRSVTFDNGKEFASHKHISTVLGADVFFARPYHSWERGTNENTNGLIRRLHAKGSSFAMIDAQEVRRIDSFLNDRPKMCLDWKTPKEALFPFRFSNLKIRPPQPFFAN